MNKLNLTGLSYEALLEYFVSIDQPKYRADQLFDWLHNKRCNSFAQMSNLSKELRNTLAETATLTTLTLKSKQQSELDGTIKFLFELEDKNCIETVFMRYKHGNSLCISTQVGCKMGCKFCASTIGGLVRNLSTGEIIAQVYEVERQSGERISNIVVMGIGEPLDNFDNLIDFLSIVSHPKGKNLSLRNITVSTCGIVPKIIELANLNLPITLAISLHCANDNDRSAIMPINKKWQLDELIKACIYYFSKTGRRLTFEYALIDGVNDSSASAKELAQLLSGLNCHINLIPINPVKERSFKKSTGEAVKIFANTLTANGYTVTIRRELGSDISAACGQLRYENG